MKITGDLLKRYSEGKCTKEEIQLVEQWLSSEDDTIMSEEEISDSPAQIRTRLFASIFPSQKSDPLPVPLYRRFYWHAAAACLAVGLTIAWWATSRYDHDVRISIDNISSEIKTFESAGLSFTIMPRSKIDLQASPLKAHTSMNFCGAVKVENLSSSDMEMNVTYTCSSPEFLRAQAICKSNKTYYLLKLNFSGKDVLLIKDNKMDTSPFVRSNLRRSFIRV